MRGLMMDFPLTVPAILRRVASLYGHKGVATRLPDHRIVHLRYAEIVDRVRRLAVVLTDLGVRPGDRVATLAWASHQHLEAYLAVPSIGAVLHTLNLRLHHDDLSYIVNDAADRVLLVDESLLPLLEKFRRSVNLERVIVTSRTSDGDPPWLDYETLLAGADPSRFTEAPLDELDAAAMCYTSGTTGRPKGVLYSHRSIVLHSFALGLRDSLAIAEDDTVLPIVPMFHVNAWGLPFAAPLFGASLVFPGPFLDPQSVLELLACERVTLTAGVPTVWLGVLHELDRRPGSYDLSPLRAIAVGGSAAPPAMIRGFQERHGLSILHAWGMTEMTPLGTICTLPSGLRAAPVDDQLRYRAAQGTPLPFVEVRARTDEGFAAWDGRTMGELEVRGPWVAARYYNTEGPDARFTDDGWFRTGDIVTIEPHGCVELTDRAKDLVKSGGEWISSVALETALMGHPAIAEAAVIAVPHPKWDERPLAVVVLRPNQTATADELRAFLEPQFAKWWLPDEFEFTSEIPRTSVGKFKKSVLRDQFKDRYQEASGSGLEA
jgi:fatty-acyl-CoA synthase